MGSWSVCQESPPGYGSHPRGCQSRFKGLHLAGSSVLTRAHLFPTPACCCLCGGWQVTVFLEGCVATHTHVSTVSPTASLCIVRRTGHPLLSCPAVPFFLPPHLPVSWLGRQDEVGPIHSDLVIPTFAPSQPNLVDLAVACACR